MSPSINNGIEALSFTNHAATDMSQHSAEGTGAVDNVAIIGAGLAGLSLALSLKRKGIESTIYELRPPTTKANGALMLSPNALRILDTLGVYERIKDQGYHFEYVAYKNAQEQTTDQYYLGQEKVYGYKALRIYRQALLTTLRAMVQEAGVVIEYGKKFSHVVVEDEDGVTFELTDGTIETAGLLIGCDGIHSTVRRYVSPSTVPVYSGQLAITCAIPRSVLRFPAGIDYHLPVAIHGKAGSFVMAPQKIDGSELLAGTQRAFPEQDKAGWDRLLNAKEELLQLFRTNMQDWPDIVQSVLENVQLDTLFIWPFYAIPKLASWASEAKRVIILGDAAHAIPPTAGQGASQAFEDSFSLAALLSKLSTQIPLAKCLKYWQENRQERIDKVIALTLKLNNSRLPQAEREKLGPGQTSQSGENGELSWLYSATIEKDIDTWIDGEAGLGVARFQRNESI